MHSAGVNDGWPLAMLIIVYAGSSGWKRRPDKDIGLNQRFIAKKDLFGWVGIRDVVCMVLSRSSDATNFAAFVLLYGFNDERFHGNSNSFHYWHDNRVPKLFICARV